MPSRAPLLSTCGRSLPASSFFRGRRGSGAVLATVLAAAASLACGEEKPGLGGVEIVPADAAYFSATLRAREQYDLIVNSNAFATIRRLPGVTRALASLDEQRMTPGNPLGMVDGFLQAPENQQALELLADMVATDTFVYAEPSCIKVLRLVQKLQAAQQGAAFGGRLRGGAGGVGGLGGLPGLPGGNDGADGDDGDDDEDDEDEERNQAVALLKVAAANLDLVVLPDLVWGFTTTKPEAAKAQLARLEALATFAAQTVPDLAEAVARKKVAGGEFVTITLPARLVTGQLDEAVAELGLDENAADGRVVAIDKLLKRLRGLDLVIAIGLVGDRVILSIGDSLDHLDKLALPGSGRKGLITHPALAPFLPHKGKRITGISYTSRELAEANADPATTLSQLTGLVDNPALDVDLSPEARAELKTFVARMADKAAQALPKPNATLSFSFLTDAGYEGYSWFWGNPLGLEGGQPLGLLSRLGGTPLAFAVSRMKSNPAAFAELVATVNEGWKLFKKHGLPNIDDDESRDQVEDFEEHVVPLAAQLAEIVGKKLLPSLADGQVGMVFDSPAKTRRLHEDLPEADQPLPLPELSFVLPLADAALFRTALSDLFELGDALVVAMRRMDPDSVPEGYQPPAPEKTKIEGGSAWSYALTGAGLDEQIRPGIAIGEKTAVFSLLPGQAGRLLGERKLETGVGLADFAKPLAGAAAADVPRIIDSLKPWVVYLIRYAAVLQRDGQVDSDAPLNADVETPEVKEIREHVAVVLEAAKAFRGSAAETTVNPEATVTHWRNAIRDLPAAK